MLYHKAFENGTSESSGVTDLFDEIVGHLEDDELKVKHNLRIFLI